MRSRLIAIAAMFCGFGLSVGVPNATLAINNLAYDLEQQAANESADRRSGAVKEEAKPLEGVTIVYGEVLRIQRNNYLVRKYTGDVLHLYLDNYTRKNEKVRRGVHIAALVHDHRHVLLMLINRVQ